MATAYHAYEQKMEDARRYRDAEEIPWRVLVDDLEGRVHQVYGGLSHPTYVVSSEGRMSFYNMWTHAPSLHKALDELTNPDGACVVRGGIDRKPHVMAYMVNGWPGLARGLPQSYFELEKTIPGMARSIRMGYKLKPMLAPIALRSKPLPITTRAMAGGAGVYLGAKLISFR